MDLVSIFTRSFSLEKSKKADFLHYTYVFKNRGLGSWLHFKVSIYFTTQYIILGSK